MGDDHWCFYTRWSTALFWLVINHQKTPWINGCNSSWSSIPLWVLIIDAFKTGDQLAHFCCLSTIKKRPKIKQILILLIPISYVGIDHWCIYTRWSTALFWLVINYQKQAIDKRMRRLLILKKVMGVDHWCIHTWWSAGIFLLFIIHQKKAMDKRM